MTLRVGLVGVGARGMSFKPAIDAFDEVTVHAVCDVDKDAIQEAAAAFDASEKFTDYEPLLQKGNIDTVVIGTPVHLHVDQATAALERDLDVVSEVPVGVSVDECRTLVQACADSDGRYGMIENFPYLKQCLIVESMVAEGLFGEVYYAEGEYLHELKALNERSGWRRRWQTGVDGITYPTHSLAPILRWFGDDRVNRVTCSGSGHHHVDADGHRYEQQDTTIMLAETEQDRLIKIRLDMLSERPHAIDNYQLQGTAGSYESARTEDDRGRVWIADRETLRESRAYEWRDLATFESKYFPERWRDWRPPDTSDIGGDDLAFRDRVLAADFRMWSDLFDALLTDSALPMDVHEALDVSLPGLYSQQAISGDPEWVEVPDSRAW
jgi:predicted dehydrogenase